MITAPPDDTRRPHHLALVVAVFALSCAGKAGSDTDNVGGQGGVDDQGGQAGMTSTGGRSTGGSGGANAGGSNAGGGAVATGGAPSATGGTTVDPVPSGKPIFVAVGYGGHRTRSLDGVRWQDHVIDDPNGGDDKNLLRGVGFANGVFVAVGDRILTSDNGAQWKKAAYTPSSFLNQACALNGLWVAAGGNGLRVRSQDKGVTWDVSVAYMDGHFRGLACGNGRFVAVGQRNNMGMTSISTDGIKWTEPNVAGAKLGRVAFGNGVFVAVGDGGRIATSSDGQTWNNSTLGTANRDMIMFNNGVFVTTEDGGFQTSPDGKVWLRIKSTGSFTAFAGAPGLWVGVLYPGKMHHGADLAKLTLGESTGPDFTQVTVGFFP